MSLLIYLIFLLVSFPMFLYTLKIVNQKEETLYHAPEES